jgi:hypothetical protein
MDLDLDLPFPLEPKYAARHAELVVTAADDVGELSLDYSPASLEEVDAVVEGFRQDGASVQELAELLVGFGCYLGEVVRRELGGYWQAEEDLDESDRAAAGWMVLAFGDCLWCNPIGRVFGRFLQGEEDYLPDFYESLLAERRRSCDTGE